MKGIPPAWTLKHESKSPYDPIQRTMLDAKGKTQYQYHPLWIILSELVKFKRILSLCNKVYKFKPDITNEQSMLLGLMVKTCIRTGNEGPCDGNIGLVNLRRQNVLKSKKRLYLKFTGKSGVTHKIEIVDKSNLDFLKDKYSKTKNKTDKLFRTTAEELNDFVRKTWGKRFTCKDIRTCQANLALISSLKKSRGMNPKKAIIQAHEHSAHLLGHTVSISKKNYTCPGIDKMFIDNPNLFYKSKCDSKILKECLHEYLEVQ